MLGTCSGSPLPSNPLRVNSPKASSSFLTCINHLYLECFSTLDVCVCVCVLRSEVKVRCPPQSLYITYFNIYYSCLSVCAHAIYVCWHMCHRLHEEVARQLCGASSSILMLVLGMGLGMPGLCITHLHLSQSLAGPEFCRLT